MNKRWNMMIGIAAVLVAVWALPVRAQENEDLRRITPENARQLEVVAQVQHAPEGEVIALAAGPGGEWLALVDEAGLWLYELRDPAGDPAEPLLLTAEDGAITCAAFDPSGELAYGTDGGAVLRWDPARGAQLPALTGHDGAVRDVAYSALGGTLVSAGADRTLHVWNTQFGLEQATIREPARDVISARFTPDGLYILAGTSSEQVHLWAALTGDYYGSVLIEPDGTVVINGAGQTFDLSQPSGNLLNVFITYVAPQMDYGLQYWRAFFEPDAAVSPGEALVVVAQLPGAELGPGIRLVDRESMGGVAELFAPGPDVQRVAFSPDGTAIASLDSDGWLRRWIVTGE